MAKLILYSFYCNECDIQFDQLAYMEERHAYCKICSHSSERVISFQGAIHVFQPYFHESLGKYIRTAQELRDEHKRQGLVPLYPGDSINPRKAAAERKKKQEEESRKSIRKYLSSGIADLINDSEPIPRIKETIERERILSDKGVTATRNWED
jgi:putative FmdB family regulatory protein